MHQFECILLVDDDPVNNFITKRLLERENLALQIISQQNGLLAYNSLLAYFDKHKKYPGLILLDINMPVMDGAEFMKKIKSLNTGFEKDIHIIVLTTSSDSRDVENMTKLGAKWFITKPLLKEKLLDILNTIRNTG